VACDRLLLRLRDGDGIPARGSTCGDAAVVDEILVGSNNSAGLASSCQWPCLDLGSAKYVGLRPRIRYHIEGEMLHS